MIEKRQNSVIGRGISVQSAMQKSRAYFTAPLFVPLMRQKGERIVNGKSEWQGEKIVVTLD
jgi:hypothetical protein